MKQQDLVVNAYTAYDEVGEFSLSAFALPLADLDETARVANRPNALIRVSTVGRIRQAGYEVVRSEPPMGHVEIKLPNPPTDADWTTLRETFDLPIPNPHRRTKETG